MAGAKKNHNEIEIEDETENPASRRIGQTYQQNGLSYSTDGQSGAVHRRSVTQVSKVVLLEAEGSNEFSVVEKAENEVEARKIYNNYVFGLRKWKSHVSSRPITTRSEIVQDLYSDINKYTAIRVSTIRISNILYSVLIGWWLALIYLLVGSLMLLTVIGRKYGFMCFRLAGYFLWPFGKFVHQYHQVSMDSVAQYMTSSTGSQELTKDAIEQVNSSQSDGKEETNENTLLLTKPKSDGSSIWKKPRTYIWLVFGVPILGIVHVIIFSLAWFFVVTIPIAKINSRTLTKILFMPPEEMCIGDSGAGILGDASRHSEIIMYTHQSFNFYYFKYTVDGVNVILTNLLVFVLLSIVIGYADEANELVSPIMKCILSILAILPVTYYIGMAITSISAQSSFAVGAILNATFGSMVEVILFIIMLKKGKDAGETCYEELVKSTLTGSILCCILLVPGMSMVVGGLKFRKQKFNPKSANISSSLLFVAIIGVFAPTIFAKIYGNLECDKCENYTGGNATHSANETGFLCSGCRTVVIGPDDNHKLYTAHIQPLVYTCALILPFAYVIGLVFSMKTHTAEIFEEFEKKQKEEGAGGHHGSAQWSRIKSAIILLLCATAIALCADLISVNIPPLLNSSGVSEYFVGVTLLSIVSMLPEIVNGTQFALQNNVNLGIEIGSAAAIQVCMVQLPIIVLADLIYESIYSKIPFLNLFSVSAPMGFNPVFNDIHLWAVIFAVIIINYIFQDGKSDYFQGSIVMFIYILLMAMYCFTVTPHQAVCHDK